MEAGHQDLHIRIDRLERLLMFDYEPGSEDALYDLCTRDGHILRTGEIKGPMTEVRLGGVTETDLVLMVLDGDRSVVQQVPLRKVG